MTNPLRIALVGAGAFGRKHLSVLAAEPGFELAGIADPSPAAQALAKEHGVPCHADAGALLDAVRPDGAIVVTPNHLHVPHGLACVERGIPALVEKPIAETPEGGEALATAAEHADVPLLVGHHRRHNPILKAAREVVSSGRLGRVVAVNLAWLLRKPDSYYDVAWRREPGGGPVMINLVHEIDTLRFVVGDIVAVRAMTSNATRGFPIEDTAAVALRFTCGALGTVIVSDAVEAPWSWEMTSGENSAYPRQPAGNGMIAGTKGSLALPHLDLWRHTPPPGGEGGWNAPMQHERIPVATDDAYHRQLRHFGRVIRREEAPRVTARDAARSLAVCLAVLELSADGAGGRVGSAGVSVLAGLEVAQHGVDGHTPLRRLMLRRLQIASEDRAPGVAVGDPVEAQRADQQVEVQRVHAATEQAVALATLEQPADNPDHDGVAPGD